VLQLERDEMVDKNGGLSGGWSGIQEGILSEEHQQLHKKNTMKLQNKNKINKHK
jgi:hypothetical protein